MKKSRRDRETRKATGDNAARVNDNESWISLALSHGFAEQWARKAVDTLEGFRSRDTTGNGVTRMDIIATADFLPSIPNTVINRAVNT